VKNAANESRKNLTVALGRTVGVQADVADELGALLDERGLLEHGELALPTAESLVLADELFLARRTAERPQSWQVGGDWHEQNLPNAHWREHE
jgi:hypothetical protein